MTVRNMFGMDEVFNDTDFRTLGWVRPASVATGNGLVVGQPSENGKAGRMVRQTCNTATTGLPGDGNVTNGGPGLFNTGLTIAQICAAGGFSLQGRVKFNSGSRADTNINDVTGSPATTAGIGINQFGWDGARYWAVRRISSAGVYTYALQFSTDLLTWTSTATLPSTMTGVLAQAGSLCISILGNNDLIVHIGAQSGAPATALNAGYRTTNGGTSWTAISNFSDTGQGGTQTGYVAGPTAGTWVMALTTLSGSTFPAFSGAYYVDAALARTQGTATAINSNARWLAMKKIGTFYLATSSRTGATNVFYTTTPATAASWTGISIPSGVTNNLVYDIVILGTRMVAATSNGLYYSSTNSPATATWTLATGTNIGIAFKIAVSTNRYVAVGSNGMVMTSTDGITWTGATQVIPNVSNVSNRHVLWDGSKFVMLCQGNGMISTSTDGTNWTLVYVADGLEASSFLGSAFGLYWGTAFNATTGAFTRSGVNGAFLKVEALSAGTRNVSMTSSIDTASSVAPIAGSTVNLSNTANSGWHYVHLIATYTGSGNAFNLQFRVDGTTILASAGPVVFGTDASDTTSLAIVNLLPRDQSLVAIDDMVFLTFDGTVNNAPTPPASIVPRRPTSDIQAQWTRVGGGATNAASVAQANPTAPNTLFLTSTVAGTKDVYGLAAPAAPSAKPLAVQVSAYINRNDTDPVKVALGIKSGNAENLGTDITVSSATLSYANQIYELDPQNGAAWSPANVAVIQPTVTNRP